MKWTAINWIVLTSGMFTSGLKVKSSLTISAWPLRADQYNAVPPSSPLALISKLLTWDCTCSRSPSCAAMWSALLFGISANENQSPAQSDRQNTACGLFEFRIFVECLWNLEIHGNKSSRPSFNEINERLTFFIWKARFSNKNFLDYFRLLASWCAGLEEEQEICLQR